MTGARPPKATLKRTESGHYCWYLRSASQHVLYISPAFRLRRDCDADRQAHLDAARAAVCEDEA